MFQGLTPEPTVTAHSEQGCGTRVDRNNKDGETPSAIRTPGTGHLRLNLGGGRQLDSPLGVGVGRREGRPARDTDLNGADSELGGRERPPPGWQQNRTAVTSVFLTLLTNIEFNLQ